MITGIEHTAVFSNDATRLTDWYAANLGFAKVYDNGKGTYFVKSSDGSMFEIIQTEDRTEIPRDHTAKGLRHVALKVGGVEELKKKADELIAAGVEVISGPDVSPKGIAAFFFRDPDGNVLHLIYRPEAL